MFHGGQTAREINLGDSLRLEEKRRLVLIHVVRVIQTELIFSIADILAFDFHMSQPQWFFMSGFLSDLWQTRTDKSSLFHVLYSTENTILSQLYVTGLIYH